MTGSQILLETQKKKKNQRHLRTLLNREADGAHQLIGKLQTTLRNWSYGSYQQALIHPSKVNRPYESNLILLCLVFICFVFFLVAINRAERFHWMQFRL